MGWVFTLLGCFAIGLLPGRALAAEELPASAPTRSGASLDLRLSVGSVRAAFWQHGLVAELDAVSLDAALRLGWFVSEHWLLGFEVVWGRHVGGELEMRQSVPVYEVPARDGHTVFAPFEIVTEVYPLSGAGAYVGASAGVGVLDTPAYGEIGGELLMGHYGFELGYHMSGSGKHGLGWFARYNGWGGVGVDDHMGELTSHDVGVGARWSFF